MSRNIQSGPSDTMVLPKMCLGKIYYDELQKKDRNRIALIDDGVEMTYGKFFDLTVKLANALKKLGVEKGDTVTILSQNNWKYLVTIISAFYIGAKVNLLNPDYTSGELKHLLKHCKPKTIFCTTKTLKTLLQMKDIPKDIIIYDAPSENASYFDDLLEKETIDGTFKTVDVNLQEVAFIMTSSGTTGFPKCVLLTHSNVRTGFTSLQEPSLFDLNPLETTVLFIPFFHVWGGGMAVASILYGTKLVILSKFIPEKFLQIIQDYKITKLFVVPPVLQFLSEHPIVEKYDLSSVTDVCSAAATVSKELEESTVKRLNVTSVRQCYGTTETSGPVTFISKNDIKYGSVGKPVVDTHIKVWDVKTGKSLPAFEVGEIRIKGGATMKGYLGNETETRDAFDDEGFMKTGDLGYYDNEGFFYLVDRLKDIIKYKGFQVSPAELEQILIAHPKVIEAGVVGKPDERAGEVPIAFVIKQDESLTEEELVHYVEENVSVQKRLYGGVRFVDAIPKNASGKILRRKLKELL